MVLGMRLISKKDCERCVRVKNYMNGKGILYEEVLVEKPEDLNIYRKMLVDNDKQLGFPIILRGSEIVNGSSEEIMSWLAIQHPESREGRYFWGR